MITQQMVLSAVSAHYQIPVPLLLARRAGVLIEWERELAMLLVQKYARPTLTLAQIGTLFGYTREATKRAGCARWAITKAECRLKCDAAYIGHAIAIGNRLQAYQDAERREMVKKVYGAAKRKMVAA